MYNLVRPILFKLQPETAHEFSLHTLKTVLANDFMRRKFAETYTLAPFGDIEIAGLKFKNPFGIAAGFDKNGIAAHELAALGFGAVEVGTTTFHAQEGNPKPRLFRLPNDKGLINRAGFNNDGTQKVVERLRGSRPNCILGMNIGKSKIVPNEQATEDYLQSFELVFDVADYVTINVSSPNTPNLRELQRADALFELLSALQKRNQEIASAKTGAPRPLFVKIAPDLSNSEIHNITQIAQTLDLSGIIATNTTIDRSSLQTPRAEIEAIGSGGLSGKPLNTRSTEVIAEIYRASSGKLPIIGVGGVFDAADAFEKIAAGASLIQVYTGFIYQGWTLARDLNKGLAAVLHEKGFASYQQAVGSRHKNL